MRSWSVLCAGLWLASCTGRGGPALPVDDCQEDGTCVCQERSDCPAGLSCVDGFCRDPSDLGGPGSFGSICDLAEDCRSGLCLPAGDGSYGRCSRSCEGSDCPQGFRCGRVLEGLRCVEDRFSACLPCQRDDDCHPAGVDSCVGGFCQPTCEVDECPAGYACRADTIGCAPAVGDCAAACEGAESGYGCARSNGFGICYGRAVCGSGGPTACNAGTATAEICNGLDDDCDGRTDEEDPKLDVSSAPGYPSCAVGDAANCVGAWACSEEEGIWGLRCVPFSPQDEVCDGLDNDCSGGVDEPFTDESGVYSLPDHCGACDVNCLELVDDLSEEPGSVTCTERPQGRTCAPLRCAPGFTPFPEPAPVACVPASTVQCQTCLADSDCRFSANRCVELSATEGRSCLQGCGMDAPYPGCTGVLGERGCCPDDSLCQLRDGVPLCVPVANSCDCRADRIGEVRSCLVGAGGKECLGIERCEAVDDGVAWSICSASETTSEICDGADNDCNGLVDETFFDTQGTGTYDVDEHCGRCFNSCLDLPQAVGACVPGSSEPECAIASCRTDVIASRETCREDDDCADGYSCDRRHFACVRACLTSSDCGGLACVDGRCADGCSSDSACQSRFGVGSVCRGGICVREYEYVDRDRDVADGCECPVPQDGALDEPDVLDSFPEAGIAYLDSNCDGVDGNAARALYVWSGSSRSIGTREDPFRTIGEAVESFDPGRHDHVLVAGGTYSEQVVLRDGVRLYGGYAQDFSSRDIAGLPTIIDPPTGNGLEAALVAEDIRQPTIFAGFVIRGPDLLGQAADGRNGATTYAAVIRASNEGLELRNNLFQGGRGQDGGRGRRGDRGDDGSSGFDGLDAIECRTATCVNEQRFGGAGGTNPACPGANGNDGGTSDPNNNPQPFNGAGLNGRGGFNATYSNASNPEFSDLCKYDCQIQGDLEGKAARSGTLGQPGRGGLGCTDGGGRLVDQAWSPFVASPGVEGTAGSGGGGGGAGGCVTNANGPSCSVGRRAGDLGASGGGGGAGGCGGGGGRPGGAGGASVAVLVVASVGDGPEIRGNVIELGLGGQGGSGGDGGVGGDGGAGGARGGIRAPAWCAGRSGRGGRGGGGGAGGAGGGGCGGATFGIAGRGVRNYGTVNDFRAVPPSGPAGGTGGQAATPSAEGRPGAAGAVAEVEEL